MAFSTVKSAYASIIIVGHGTRTGETLQATISYSKHLYTDVNLLIIGESLLMTEKQTSDEAPIIRTRGVSKL